MLVNIFILDDDIARCAQYHCDQHVNKMILESVQLLCTALNKKGIETPYRSTHIKHPCILWVESSLSNFRWLCQLAVELNREFCWRFQRAKDHASIQVLRRIESFCFDDCGLTPFAQAMPDHYKVPGNAIAAYRRFYIGEKSQFATWQRREAPAWYRVE